MQIRKPNTTNNTFPVSNTNYTTHMLFGFYSLKKTNKKDRERKNGKGKRINTNLHTLKM